MDRDRNYVCGYWWITPDERVRTCGNGGDGAYLTFHDGQRLYACHHHTGYLMYRKYLHLIPPNDAWWEEHQTKRGYQFAQKSRLKWQTAMV